MTETYVHHASTVKRGAPTLKGCNSASRAHRGRSLLVGREVTHISAHKVFFFLLSFLKCKATLKHTVEPTWRLYCFIIFFLTRKYAFQKKWGIKKGLSPVLFDAHLTSRHLLPPNFNNDMTHKDSSVAQRSSSRKTTTKQPKEAEPTQPPR